MQVNACSYIVSPFAYKSCYIIKRIKQQCIQNKDTVKSFLKALKKAYDFMELNSEKVVAEKIVKNMQS